MMSSLEGRVALVTGGSRGIGFATGRILARRGAAVVLSARDEDQLGASVDKLTSEGATATAVAADVSNERVVVELIEAALEWKGNLDILVYAAGGVERSAPTQDLSLDDWNRSWAVNTTGAFLCCRAALPSMLSQGYGRIITVSSRAAVGGGVLGRGSAQANVHYAASKAGLIGFTQALAREVAGRGVTANVVAPGPIASEQYVQKRTEADLEKITQLVPVSRLGTPDDVADAVLYLASDKGYVTGQVLHVNGGTWIG